MVAKQLEVPVFHPTLKDISEPFEKYIERIEKKFAHVGICKIVAPEGWTPRKTGYPNYLDLEIPRPIRQHATGKKGLFRTLLVEHKPMSLRHDFKPQATASENLPPGNRDDYELLERRFWKNVTLRPPLYGADVEGSLFDKRLKEWNLRNLDSLLTRTLKSNKLKLPGVNTPYLYFGMWRSTFAWHTEDLDLHSVNYLHYGAPKSWYAIPPDHKSRFENLVKGMLPDLFRACPEFFRHKELLVSPHLLQLHNIPVVKLVQYPGEFVINYPGAYHSGFNHGYNCAESTNFATKTWIGIGTSAGICECHPDSVKIQMSLFLDAASPRVRKRIRERMAAEETSSSESEEEQTDSDSSSEEEEEEDVSPQRKRQKAPPKASGGRSMAAVQAPGRSMQTVRRGTASVKPAGAACTAARGRSIAAGRSMTGASSTGGGRSMAGRRSQAVVKADRQQLPTKRARAPRRKPQPSKAVRKPRGAGSKAAVAAVRAPKQTAKSRVSTAAAQGGKVARNNAPVHKSTKVVAQIAKAASKLQSMLAPKVAGVVKLVQRSHRPEPGRRVSMRNKDFNGKRMIAPLRQKRLRVLA